MVFFRGDSELHLQFNLNCFHMILEIFIVFTEITGMHQGTVSIVEIFYQMELKKLF